MSNPLPIAEYAYRRPPPPPQRNRRSTDRTPRTGWFPVLTALVLTAAADCATKGLVRGYLPLNSFTELWPGRVALWHVQNPAMILGLHGNLPLASRQAITVLTSLLALVVLVDVVNRGHRLRAEHQPITWLCAGLAFGGMLGNFGERLLYWHVTDFLSVRVGSTWLPPTNLADLAIIASLPLTALVVRYEREARRQRRSARVHELPARKVPSG